jgi:hypothetical protein
MEHYVQYHNLLRHALVMHLLLTRNTCLHMSHVHEFNNETSRNTGIRYLSFNFFLIVEVRQSSALLRSTSIQ